MLKQVIFSALSLMAASFSLSAAARPTCTVWVQPQDGSAQVLFGRDPWTTVNEFGSQFLMSDEFGGHPGADFTVRLDNSLSQSHQAFARVEGPSYVLALHSFAYDPYRVNRVSTSLPVRDFEVGAPLVLNSEIQLSDKTVFINLSCRNVQ